MYLKVPSDGVTTNLVPRVLFLLREKTLGTRLGHTTPLVAQTPRGLQLLVAQTLQELHQPFRPAWTLFDLCPNALSISIPWPRAFSLAWGLGVGRIKGLKGRRWRVHLTPWTISFPEAAILLVRRRGSRPLARSNSGSSRFTDFPSLCACPESSLTNLIGSGLNLLCLHSHSKPECR